MTQVELESFKQRVVDLASRAWPEDRPSASMADSLVAVLCEESGELARAVRSHWERRWGHPEETSATADNVTEEIGDLLFILARISQLCGVSLDDAATVVQDKISDRTRRVNA